MSIFHTATGFLMLIAGRPFYPSFVAGVSYLSIYWLIEQFNWVESQMSIMWISLFIALAIGIMTFELRRWAAVAGAFIAGGYILFYVPGIFRLNLELPWPFFLIAGGLCIILIIFLFDFTLMMLSAITGAAMIVQTVSFGNVDPIAIFFVLIIFSLTTQFVLLRYGESSPD